ncbi:hypothetical protein Tco_0453647 [Tanacetum coccineum]
MLIICSLTVVVSSLTVVVSSLTEFALSSAQGYADLVKQWESARCPESSSETKIWGKLNEKMNIDSIPKDWRSIIEKVAAYPCNNAIRIVLRRIILATAVYYIWRERNSRIFADVKMSTVDDLKKIVGCIRLQLQCLNVKKTSQVCKVAQEWNVVMNRGYRVGWVLDVLSDAFHGCQASYYHGNMMPTLSGTNNTMLKKKRGPVIYYATRTHSQISQVIGEFRKTNYHVPMAVLLPQGTELHYSYNEEEVQDVAGIGKNALSKNVLCL